MLEWLLAQIGANANSTGTEDGLTLGAVMGSEFFTLILSGVIAFIVTYITQYYLVRPKIKVAIFNMSVGQLGYDLNNVHHEHTFYAPYIYVTNHHQSSVFMLDYSMEIDFGEGFTKLDRIYDPNFPYPEPFKGETANEIILIPKFGTKLIYAAPQAVSFGEIIKGFLAFVGPPSFYGKEILRIKFSCTDALQKTHTTEVTPKDYLSVSLFYALVGATVIRKPV